MMIFAHGPWFTEWHHLLDLWPVLVTAGAGVGVWLRARLPKREVHREESHVCCDCTYEVHGEDCCGS